jgi:hypothetical protein
VNQVPAIPVRLDDILARLDAMDAKLDKIIVERTSPVPRIAYTRKEFAAMTGRSVKTLKHPKHYRALGGRKVGGRIMFSEAARLALMEGKK